MVENSSDVNVSNNSEPLFLYLNENKHTHTYYILNKKIIPVICNRLDAYGSQMVSIYNKYTIYMIVHKL